MSFDIPAWPGHLAGQHVDVRLTAEDGYQAARSYSLAQPATGDRIAITVQQVPDGEVSPYLTDVLSVGDPVELRGPLGGWFVWRPAETNPVLLVAGGSGIVPLMAMVRARRAAGSMVPFRLLYSVRTPADLYYAEELRVPRGGDLGVDVNYVFTRSSPDGFARAPARIGVADINSARLAAGLRADLLRLRPDRFRRDRRRHPRRPRPRPAPGQDRTLRTHWRLT